MNPSASIHNSLICDSFAKQAKRLASYHMSKAEYTDYLIRKIDPRGNERVLETAAGTCVCARALSPYVHSVECLDLSEEMLLEGKRLSEESNLSNLTFRAGDACRVSSPGESFDLVITRLSLHHFLNPEIPFKEMRRVLKPGGKLVIWDMCAADEPLRGKNDTIERLRDPSHVKKLSQSEMEALFENDFFLQTEEMTEIPVSLKSWMAVTGVPAHLRREITGMMNAELLGGEKTGFGSYLQDGEIMFHHHWLLLIGIKTVSGNQT